MDAHAQVSKLAWWVGQHVCTSASSTVNGIRFLNRIGQLQFYPAQICPSQKRLQAF